MLAKKITSLQHNNVLHWVRLRKERPLREETRSVLIVGKTLVKELAPVRTLITLDEAPEIAAEERFLVTEPILKKITGLEKPDGYAAVLDLPPPASIESFRSCLILDRISDPGNLGTLVRSAHSLGWEAVLATPGSVDYYNDKALRAAKGSTFRIPCLTIAPDEIMRWVTKNRISFYIADLGGEALGSSSLSLPCSILLGSESHGPGPLKKLGRTVSIPMQAGADSLNVAAAGAIFLYTMRPQ
jgi:TrmH family RNA methyltransferase